MRLHILLASQAGRYGGVAESLARGRALQRDAGLGYGRGQRGGKEGDGDGALCSALSVLATGHGLGGCRRGEVMRTAAVATAVGAAVWRWSPAADA